MTVIDTDTAKQQSMSTLGKCHGYTIIRQVGSGTYGTVFFASHRKGGKCAIKAMTMHTRRSKPGVAKHEVDIHASLDSPHVVRFWESFIEDGILAIVMDFATTGDLWTLLDATRCADEKLGEWKVLRCLTQALLGVEYLHQCRIIHRDLSSRNLFFKTIDRLQIGDFGSSHTLKECRTFVTSPVVGTPYYMSPELCSDGTYSFASDIWALGCILYEMTALRTPFDGPSLPKLVANILEGEIPAISCTYSKDLQKLCRQMLSRSRVLRPSSAALIHVSLIQTEIAQLPPEQKPNPHPRGPLLSTERKHHRIRQTNMSVYLATQGTDLREGNAEPVHRPLSLKTLAETDFDESLDQSVEDPVCTSSQEELQDQGDDNQEVQDSVLELDQSTRRFRNGTSSLDNSLLDQYTSTMRMQSCNKQASATVEAATSRHQIVRKGHRAVALSKTARNRRSPAVLPKTPRAPSTFVHANPQPGRFNAEALHHIPKHQAGIVVGPFSSTGVNQTTPIRARVSLNSDQVPADSRNCKHDQVEKSARTSRSAFKCQEEHVASQLSCNFMQLKPLWEDASKQGCSSRSVQSSTVKLQDFGFLPDMPDLVKPEDLVYDPVPSLSKGHPLRMKSLSSYNRSVSKGSSCDGQKDVDRVDSANNALKPKILRHFAFKGVSFLTQPSVQDMVIVGSRVSNGRLKQNGQDAAVECAGRHLKSSSAQTADQVDDASVLMTMLLSEIIDDGQHCDNQCSFMLDTGNKHPSLGIPSSSSKGILC